MRLPLLLMNAITITIDELITIDILELIAIVEFIAMTRLSRDTHLNYIKDTFLNISCQLLSNSRPGRSCRTHQFDC